MQFHAFIHHLSLLSSSEFLCALTQGVPHRGIQLLPAVLLYASLISQSDSAPSSTHQAALLHSDTSSGSTQMPLASGTISLSVRGQGPTQSEKNGTQLLTPWAHRWLPGRPCSFLGDCFFHWDVTILAAAPAFFGASQLEIVIKEPSPLCY